MTARAKGLTLVVLLGFVAFLLWSTLSSQQVECTVAVDFRGRSGTATASAASKDNAVREAQTAACGPISAGMDDRIACSGTPPVTQHCRTL